MYQCSTATHVVYPKGHKGGRKEDAADDALHVSSEWLEKSIKVSQGCQIPSIMHYSLRRLYRVTMMVRNLVLLTRIWLLTGCYIFCLLPDSACAAAKCTAELANKLSKIVELNK